MTFKPNMEAIERWVAEGQVSSDLSKATREALKKQIPDVLGAAARICASPDGKLLMTYLAEIAVLRPPVDHRLEGEQYLRYAQLRQGQQQFFATIIELKTMGDELFERKTDEHSRHSNGDRGDDLSSGGAIVRGDDLSRSDSGWSDFDSDGDIRV